MFVIPCKYNQDYPMIQKCVESIKKFHPIESIIVVDSDSIDKSYFPDIINTPNLTLFDAKNKNYVEGALWFAYEIFPNEKNYWILHDSTELLTNLDEYEDLELAVLSHFYDTTSKDYPRWSDDAERERETWARNKFKETNLEFIDGHCQAVFGSNMMISNNLMKELKSLSADKFLPTSKKESEAMERVWGMIFLQMGYNLPDYSIEGELGETHETFTKIRKTILSRS